MRARDGLRSAALGLAATLLALPPVARAEVALRARSARQATPVERALTGGLITLRSPGSTMIRVVASTFVMGSTPEEIILAVASCSREPLGYRCSGQTFGNEGPQRTLRLPSYWLDRREVTAEAYDHCAERGACTPRGLAGGARRFAQKDLPATFVSARDAETYCRTRGARLPSEAEFERAARGTEGRRYPWGDFYNGRLANHGRVGLDASDWSDGYAELAPVGSFPSGSTPDGFLDLAGNAAEWTADAYSERYDLAPDPAWGGARAIRGGDYETGAAWLRGAARMPLSPDDRRPSVGFRCARSLSAGEASDAETTPTAAQAPP
jgi:sulfatase modifying factor 1